jgi:hypothetical protein
MECIPSQVLDILKQEANIIANLNTHRSQGVARKTLCKSDKML